MISPRPPQRASERRPDGCSDIIRASPREDGSAIDKGRPKSHGRQISISVQSGRRCNARSSSVLPLGLTRRLSGFANPVKTDLEPIANRGSGLPGSCEESRTKPLSRLSTAWKTMITILLEGRARRRYDDTARAAIDGSINRKLGYLGISLLLVLGGLETDPRETPIILAAVTHQEPSDGGRCGMTSLLH